MFTFLMKAPDTIGVSSLSPLPVLWVAQRWCLKCRVILMTSLGMKDNMLRVQWWEKRSSLDLSDFNEQLNPCQRPSDFLLSEKIKTLTKAAGSSDILLVAANAFLTDAFITEKKWALTPLVIPQNNMQIIKIPNNSMRIKLRRLLNPAWEACVLWIGVRDLHTKLNVYLKWPEEK